MQEQILFPVVLVVVVVAGLGILRRWPWVPEFVQELSFSVVVVETVVECFVLLSLDNC